MFSCVSTIALLALPLLAAAGEPSSQCNTGPVQCCNQVGTAKTIIANDARFANLLDTFVGPATAILGVSCTPVSVIGVGGNSCTAQPVCCTGNQFNGLINVGCTPVNANL
ncbi:hypothetical protein CVT25_006077 [Psilocybe cyanescens]|uniref:Hydrophobin n=1 Tax=Psilocybe cyanescens TaxID=93625 RepID=A0A409X9Y5_PSICY|nr:hypothetical protein CVT25_006077 [Psilocybe cyanescens]